MYAEYGLKFITVLNRRQSNKLKIEGKRQNRFCL